MVKLNPFFVSSLGLSDRSFLKLGDPAIKLVRMALEDSQIFPESKKKKKKDNTVFLKEKHLKEERVSFTNIKITLWCFSVFFLFLNLWCVF